MSGGFSSPVLVLLIDLTHTSHTRARTGIQRVCRSLHRSLREQGSVAALCLDPYEGRWRPLRAWEEKNLTSVEVAARRGARWPWHARIRGRLARWRQPQASSLSGGTGLIVPEIFSPAAAHAFPSLFAAVRGPRVAVFHDAIVLKLPEMSPPKTVARFPGYLRELAMFDGIAAISEDSRDSLLDYWKWANIRNHPPVVAIPLGIDPPPSTQLPAQSSLPCGDPVVLSVGTIEGRKNHLTLLEACEQLWARGLLFRLHLVGIAHPETGREAVRRIRQLQAAGRALDYDGPISESGLLEAYARCRFTVYPSLLEGFGLPVLESLTQGKPCICSSGGALAEAARGGGCLTLQTSDTHALATAMARLLQDPGELGRLSNEARTRQYRNWSDHSRQLTSWMATLPPRGVSPVSIC